MENKRYLLLITGMVMGGAERVMATIANELVERGNEVVLVTMKEAISAYRLDSRVKFVGANGTLENNGGIKRKFELIFSGVKGIRFYIKKIKENNPDIVISFLTNTNLMAVIINKVLFKNIPVIISERCDPENRGVILTKIYNWIYPKADCIVCQSSKVANYFNSINSNSVVKVIKNPINEEVISDKIPEKRRKVIVAVGRLNKQKNFSLLIESFNLIKDEFPDYSIEIFGQGPEKDNLFGLINSLSLDNRIKLMGTRDKVMQYAYDSSLYVMSSNFEGFPNALTEAMASGLPVICTDFPTGVAKELIKDGLNGYIVPVGDVEKMALAMKNILSDYNLQERMSKENRKIVKVLNKKQIVDEWVMTMKKYIV